MKGFWHSDWHKVVEAFEENFLRSGEQGAGLAIYQQGELAVNIWAGVRDNRLTDSANAPWDENSIVNIFSAGKGLVALCVLQLVAQGKLVLDEPVASYWPEFSVNGKASITLRQVLCHRSGISAFHDRVNDADIYDWRKICTLVAEETSWWTPDSLQGYSPFLFGWLLGELVCRVSGCATFNEYFQENIAAPLQLQCYFGVPEELLMNVADTGPLKRPLGSSSVSNGADSVALGKLMKLDPRGVTNRAFTNPMSLLTSSNTEAWRRAQIPAANAHTNAIGLAKIYGLLASGGEDLLPPNILPLCWQEQTFSDDQTLGLPLRFSAGFMLSQPERLDCRYGRGARAFGHPGAGGCVGFADPDYGIGFGYVTSRMGQGLLIDERAVRLINAAYAVIEG